MSNLEKLYYDLISQDGQHGDTEETRKAHDAVELAIGKEAYAKCEDEICACMAANEKQGFIFGFRYAVSLLMDGKVAGV